MTRSNLLDPNLNLLIVAVLVQKLGGKVTITQADIDLAAYHQLQEEGKENGELEFTLLERNRS